MKLFYKSKQKCIAYLLCLAIALFSCFSFYMVSEATHHDCIGDNCPTCAYIETVAESLKQLGDGAVVTTETVLFSFNHQTAVIKICLTIFISFTLVSAKVRLND